MTDVRELKSIQSRSHRDEDLVRNRWSKTNWGTERDRLGREVMKLGPRILRYYSKSKMAVILLKQSKNCTWNSMCSHNTSYITKEGVQKVEAERLKEEHSKKHEE